MEVLGEGEIRATLDADGKRDGLPFVPEMRQFCGRCFRVQGRVEKVYLDGRRYVARMADTVLLEGVRCDGGAHGGCQLGCFLLWKEAWLRPAEGSPSSPAEGGLPVLRPATAGDGNGTFSCQATQIVEASTRFSRWELWRYRREYSCGERSLRELLQMVRLGVVNKTRRRLGLHLHGKICGHQEKTPSVCLNLRPGERVRVKSRQQIKATLDSLGRNRGLVFTTDMVRFCGETFRVARRVEKGVLEWSGQMCQFRNTVALEGATCSGIAVGCCGRRCYHLWREAWLERVDSVE